MKTYYISAKTQFGENGYICTDSTGRRIYEGMQQASRFDLETRVSNCIVAKAMESGCLIKSTQSTVVVSFKKGSASGQDFVNRVESDGYDPDSLVSATQYGDTIRYEFKKQYALGQ